MSSKLARDLDFSSAHLIGTLWVGVDDLVSPDPGLSAYVKNPPRVAFVIVNNEYKFAQLCMDDVTNPGFLAWCFENGYYVPVWAEYLILGYVVRHGR